MLLECWGSQTTPDPHKSRVLQSFSQNPHCLPLPAFLMFDTCENLDSILALIRLLTLFASLKTHFFNIFNRWLEENEFYVTIGSI